MRGCGPVASGPVTSGPVASGPVASGAGRGEGQPDAAARGASAPGRDRTSTSSGYSACLASGTGRGNAGEVGGRPPVLSTKNMNAKNLDAITLDATSLGPRSLGMGAPQVRPSELLTGLPSGEGAVGVR